MSNVEERLVDASTEDVKLLKNEYIYELRLIEALLFASQHPLKIEDIQERLPIGTPVKELRLGLEIEYR